MRNNLLAAAIASALAAVSSHALAQSSATPDKTAPAGSMENRYGRSPACDAKSGAEKEQCLRDEARKTQGSPPESPSTGSNATAGGSIRQEPIPVPSPSTSEASGATPRGGKQ